MHFKENERIMHELLREETRSQDLERALAKANGDITLWKGKYEVARISADEKAAEERQAFALAYIQRV